MLDERDPSFFNYIIEPLADEGRVPDQDLICWQAPSIATLGWIPVRTAADELPAYFRATWNQRLALRLLLGSGNSAPPDTFDGPAYLLAYLTGKDYRAALGIDEPKLYCQQDGTPRRFTCWGGHKVGFTPLGLPGHPVDHMPGFGDHCFTVTSAGDQVTLNYWIAFKLGKLADWAGTTMTGHRAPSAILNVQLTIRSSGSAYVTFLSSFVPSQKFYVDWRHVDEYNMLSCSESEFRGFVEAGKCKNAPLVRRFGMELKAKRIR